MTAKELMAHLAKECEVSEAAIADVLQALADAAVEEFRAGRHVALPGIGTLRLYTYRKGGTSLQCQSADGLLASIGIESTTVSKLGAKGPGHRAQGRK